MVESPIVVSRRSASFANASVVLEHRGVMKVRHLIGRGSSPLIAPPLCPPRDRSSRRAVGGRDALDDDER